MTGTPGNPETEGAFSALEREIIELHQFFQDWYNGELPDTDEAFSRFERALAPGFHIVTPEAQVVERERILESVRADRATHGDSNPPIRIWIENVRLRTSLEEVHIVTYDEWHAEQGAAPHRHARGRLSTAVFRIPTGQGDIQWLHLHETRLPPTNRSEREPAHA